MAGTFAASCRGLSFRGQQQQQVYQSRWVPKYRRPGSSFRDQACAFTSAHLCKRRKHHVLRPRTNVQPIICMMPQQIQTFMEEKHHPSSFSLFNSFTSDNLADRASISDEYHMPQIKSGTSIYDALHSTIQMLEDQSIPEPDESASHLLSYALNLSWEGGYRQLREVSLLPSMSTTEKPATVNNQPILDLARQTLTPGQCDNYQSLLKRRLQLEPLQYIVGKWDFHFLTELTIREPMLCPRPETEELVELVLADVKTLIQQKNANAEEADQRIRILDVGAGTGAIGIAIAHQYPSHVQVVALDVLPEAVELSNENAEKFLSGCVGDNAKVQDVYQAILCSAKDFTNDSNEHGDASTAKYAMNFDIVVSNPPYIPSQDMEGLTIDVVGYESDKALCGGDDGLNVIRDIVQRLPEWVRPEDASQRMIEEQRHCWMEVDDSHPAMMAKWLAPGSEEALRWGVEYMDGLKDFCGRDRFVKLTVLHRNESKPE